jgi:hypothetical protein
MSASYRHKVDELLGDKGWEVLFGKLSQNELERDFDQEVIFIA